MIKHYTLLIKGQVQKVGFRFVSLQMAYEYGIKGFARNQKEDESVYIEAEGEEEALCKFLKWVRKGPLGAEVTSVDVKEDEVKNYKSFEIAHDNGTHKKHSAS
jgi:acylphosphatase